MKKVLIALDYDPTAQRVAELGYLVAKSMDAEITLLHVVVNVVQYSASYLNMGPLQTDGVGELQNIALLFLEKIKQHLNDNSIKTIIKEGDFATNILITASDLQADIIVMGSHSKKWLEDILMGSVTEQVLQHTTIPLIIVPTKKTN